MTLITDLPDELIYRILELLESPREFIGFARSCKAAERVCRPKLQSDIDLRSLKNHQSLQELWKKEPWRRDLVQRINIDDKCDFPRLDFKDPPTHVKEDLDMDSLPVYVNEMKQLQELQVVSCLGQNTIEKWELLLSKQSNLTPQVLGSIFPNIKDIDLKYYLYDDDPNDLDSHRASCLPILYYCPTLRNCTFRQIGDREKNSFCQYWEDLSQAALDGQSSSPKQSLDSLDSLSLIYCRFSDTYMERMLKSRQTRKLTVVCVEKELGENAWGSEEFLEELDFRPVLFLETRIKMDECFYARLKGMRMLKKLTTISLGLADHMTLCLDYDGEIEDMVHEAHIYKREPNAKPADNLPPCLKELWLEMSPMDVPQVMGEMVKELAERKKTQSWALRKIVICLDSKEGYYVKYVQKKLDLGPIDDCRAVGIEVELNWDLENRSWEWDVCEEFRQKEDGFRAVEEDSDSRSESENVLQ